MTTASTSVSSSAPARLLQLTLVPVLLIIIWQLWATYVASDPRTPMPTKVAATFVDLVATGGLVGALLQSLLRVISGFAIALVTGTTLGVLMGSYPGVRNSLDPIVEAFRPLAPMAILPIILLWFGTGTLAATAIVTYAAFFPLLLNTISGVRNVDRRLVDAARTMGVGRAALLTKVIVPAAFPTVMVGFRLAFAGAWAAIIAAELIGSPSSLGFAIEWYRQLLMSSKVFAFIVTIGFLGYLCDVGLRALQRWLTPWAEGTGLS